MTWIAQAMHVFRKDVRRLWPGLVGVAAVLVLGVLNLLPDRLGPPLRVDVVPLVLALAAVFLIRQDTPASDRDLWPTLPLHAGAVLTAKLAFISLLLVLVPVTVETVWLSVLHPALPVLPVAGASIIHLFAVLIVAALGASVTRSLRGLVLLFVATWVGMRALDVSLGIAGVPMGYALVPRQPESQAVLALACSLVLGYQFRTRRTARSLVLGLSVLLLLPWLPMKGRSSDQPRTRAVETSSTREIDRPVDVRIRLDDLTRNGPWLSGPQRPETHVSAQASVEGEPGTSVRVTRVETRLTGPGIDDSFTFSSIRAFGSSPLGVRPVIPGLQPAGRLPDFFGPTHFLPLAQGTTEDIDGLAAARRLELTATLEVHDWVEMGRFAAAPGAVLELDEGTSIRVRSVRFSGDELSLQVAFRWQVSSPFRLQEWRLTPDEDLSFVLHSKPNREYLIDTGSQLMPVTRSLLGSTRLREARTLLTFDARVAGYGRSGRPPLPEDWFDDVEIVVLERQVRGHVTKGFAWELDGWPGELSPVRIAREGTPLER